VGHQQKSAEIYRKSTTNQQQITKFLAGNGPNKMFALPAAQSQMA
jgi:hypothetical protein